MEEGRGTTLEMTPLTQASSFDDGGNDDDENLAELLWGSLEESTSARSATSGVGDGGDKGAISAAPKSADCTSSGAALLENSRTSIDGIEQGAPCSRNRGSEDGEDGEDAADHDSNDTRCWQSSGATSGSLPSSKKGRRARALDSEVRRGPSKDSDSRNESGGRLEANSNGVVHVEGVLESFEGEQQTTSAVWRELLVPVKLLQEKRVRAILFVYGVYSVR